MHPRRREHRDPPEDVQHQDRYAVPEPPGPELLGPVTIDHPVATFVIYRRGVLPSWEVESQESPQRPHRLTWGDASIGTPRNSPRDRDRRRPAGERRLLRQPPRAAPGQEV